MGKKQSQSSDSYSIIVKCSNCGYSGTVTIPMGTTVNNSTCPHCGCRTISNYSFTKTEPRMKHIDEWYDPVDRALRPNKFPWLNTIMSTAGKSDDKFLTVHYSNNNGDETLEVNGTPIGCSDMMDIEKAIKEIEDLDF